PSRLRLPCAGVAGFGGRSLGAFPPLGGSSWDVGAWALPRCHRGGLRLLGGAPAVMPFAARRGGIALGSVCLPRRRRRLRPLLSSSLSRLARFATATGVCALAGVDRRYSRRLGAACVWPRASASAAAGLG